MGPRSNPTAKANASARRRNREAAGASVRALTLDELYARDNGVCYRCRLPVPRHKATKDHVIPLSKGGRDTPGNSKLACRPCNSAKKDRTIAQIAKAEARPGLKRRAWRPKPKPLTERAAAARERRQYDQSADVDVYFDQVLPDEVF